MLKTGPPRLMFQYGQAYFLIDHNKQNQIWSKESVFVQQRRPFPSEGTRCPALVFLHHNYAGELVGDLIVLDFM